jgi:ATP-dependent RNA helicase DeaD
MLRMGFIDDVEWILEQTPKNRQIALFSATMPQQIRRIATKYLNEPVEITIKMKTTTASTIRQRFWPVSGLHKLDALTRILEAEDFDAIIVFVRTKNSTVELAEKLEARGYSAAALNGDIPQNQRERTITQIKNGKIDIIVATDVAARGLDVERISHVINYDVPYDTEAYVHRIGRTGRAGRQGDAILFVAPREKNMLNAIERATRQKIEMMELPSTEIINDKRIDKFKQRITDALANEEIGIFSQLIEQYQQEHNVPAVEIAAALAQMLQGDADFLLSNKPQRKTSETKSREDWDREQRPGRERAPRRERDRDRGGDRERAPRREMTLEEGMQRYRVEVGHEHKVKPGNIVGAIANEAGIDSKHIGRIDIYDDYSLVDLPASMDKEALNLLKKVWVAGQQLKITPATGDEKSAMSVDRKSDGRKPDSQKIDSRRSPNWKPASRVKEDKKGKGRGNDEPKGKLSLKKRVRAK